MRVLFSTLSLDARQGGGTGQRTRFLAAHLARTGTICTVITMDDGDLAQALRAEGIEVYATGYLKPRYHVPLINLFHLDRMVRDVDVLHILGYWNLLSIAVAWRARRHAKPYLLSGAGEFMALDSSSLVKKWFHNLIGKRMIAGASGLVAITELERQFIVGKLGVDPASVTVIPNGVEDPPDELASHVGLPQFPFILFLGRLAHIKGPDLLLDAFAQIADQFSMVSLVFAGPDGGMLSELQTRSVDLGLENRVMFTGFLDEAARAAAYRKSLMLAVPSRDEAMSLVALEAGTFAKPVLLTDRCGFDVETIGGGLVVPATQTGLSAGLVALLANPDHLADMGMKLKDHVTERYAWSAVAESLLERLQAAIGSSRMPRHDRIDHLRS